MPNDDWETFNNDPRTKCKYGENCYQRNPEHHKTYKHPPRTTKAVKETREKRRFSPFTRKPKDSLPKTDVTEDKPDSPERVKYPKDDLTKKDVSPEDHSTSSNISNNISSIEDFEVGLPDNIDFYDKQVDKKIFEDLFLVEMPTDFFKLFDCLNIDNNIEKLLASVGLELIGPYDLLLGKLPRLEDKDLYLVHWRFFYDPPEFQAIIKKKGASQFHIGYYRDSPEEKPVFVATNDSEKDYRITPVADNIVAAVYLYLTKEKNKSPFTAMACKKIMGILEKVARDNNLSLDKYSIKKRQAQLVAKTLHGAGIVVPYNKKTQLGYRFLAETDETIKKIFTKIHEAKTQDEKDKALTELQPVITYASIAVDECDFGTGLEAGIDLFCSGLKELHSSALGSLSSVYTLLNREAFRKIIAAHLKYRRKGANLSILDFK